MDLGFINMCCTARRLADVCSRSAFSTFTVKINALDNSSTLIKLLSFLRDFSFLLFNDTFSAFLYSVSSSFRIRCFYLFLFVGFFFCIPSSLGSKLEPSQSWNPVKVEAGNSFAVENIICVRVAATDGRNPQPSPLSCQLFVLFPLISNNLWYGSKRYTMFSAFRTASKNYTKNHTRSQSHATFSLFTLEGHKDGGWQPLSRVRSHG